MPQIEEAPQTPHDVQRLTLLEHELLAVEERISATAGSKAIMSPNVWSVANQSPEAARALGAMGTVMSGIIRANERLYKGTSVIGFGDDPEQPHGLGFAGDGHYLTPRELEQIREEVVQKANDKLTALQSPHRL